MTKYLVLFKDETGSSIIEVMIATVVFIIIMVGGLNYYLQPRIIIVREKVRRLAVSAGQQRMETLRALDFSAVTADSNETDTSITLGAINGLRSTTVTLVDDAADGLAGADADADTVDYKTILVTVSWTSGNQQQLAFSTIVSKNSL